jgi:hypothetical protein
MPYYQITGQTWFNIDYLRPTTRHIQFAIDNLSIERIPGYEFIGIEWEPDEVSHLEKQFIENHKKYDILLTTNELTLTQCSNAVLFIPASTWIPSNVYENIDISCKRRIISNLSNSKLVTPDHHLRRNMYMNQLNINSPIPCDWLRSKINNNLPNINNNKFIGKSCSAKTDLFLSYQFSMVFENVKKNNGFTEKLIDCLITKTIPIYYGAPNIDKWFDTRGWIILDELTPEELNMKIQNIGEYNDFLETINDNYERSKKYVCFHKNVCNALNIH